ncbi:MAG: S1C family serine protease [Clostridium sp.]
MSEKNNEFNFSKENDFKKFGASDKKRRPILVIIILLLIIVVMIISSMWLGLGFKDIAQKLSYKPNNTQTNNNNNNLVNLEEYSKTSEGVAAKVLPSIVGISIEYTVSSPFQSGVAKASGSGIIISKDGYILTNNHVVNPKNNNSFFSITEAKSITVTFNDDTKVQGEIVGTDEQTDLAVIKVKKDNLVPATLGNSDNVKIGEFAMAIGSPLGLKSTVTAGIISAINRKIELQDGKTFTSIQTDASINEGNSGGALVNRHGEVIGINTLKFAGNGVEGIGFSIPINQTKKITEQLIKNKKVERPSLGIMGKEITKEMAEVLNIKSGVYVSEVIANSSAANSGLKKGDIITKFNNKEVTTVADINNEKNNVQINQLVDVEYIRGGKKQTVKMKMQVSPNNTTNTQEQNKNIQQQQKQENQTQQKQENNNIRNFFGSQNPFDFE